jgi:hypothetical protein
VESTRLIKIVCGHHYQPEEMKKHIPKAYVRHNQWNKEQETAKRGEQQDHTRGQTRKNRKRTEERN